MIGTGQKTVVIVDDTPANLRLLADILSSEGYRVRPAPNGERALATIQKELPDLILLDILMPEMDGYEVCRRLKANPSTRDIPIIFVSALNETVEKVMAFTLGAVDFVTKPFQVEEVLARVRTHLSLEDLRQQLRNQNLELQDKNAELDAFASTVAHDLKNPLATLMSSLRLAEVSLDTTLDESREMIQLGLHTVRKMSSIIDELLLLSSIRRQEVQCTPVDMADVVAQALARLESVIEQTSASVSVLPAWPTAMGYAPWIEEVWVNYLSNAIKYGGAPARIELGATLQADGQMYFWVRDNGPGLSVQAQQKLFTDFTRLDNARATGYGLGLSIVRRIMNKLNGSCGVESQVGQGSTFYFILRMA